MYTVQFYEDIYLELINNNLHILHMVDLMFVYT